MPPCLAVVDDDLDLIDLMPLVLADLGWKCLPITDSATACDVIAAATPDAMLLDLHLESRNGGMDIARQLGDRPETAGIPVILWTADARFVDEQGTWLQERGIKILSKPFELDELSALLDALTSQGSTPRPSPSPPSRGAEHFDAV
jgi:DNA-binding response OmpR family regulator